MGISTQGAIVLGEGNFTPIQIPNCALWLPTRAYTFSGTTLIGKDLSGQGNNCNQATGINQPTIVSQLGGPSYLNFTGSQFLNGTLSTNANQAITIFALLKDDGALGSGTRFILQMDGQFRFLHFSTSFFVNCNGSSSDPSPSANDVVYSAMNPGLNSPPNSNLWKNGTFVNSGVNTGTSATTNYVIGADAGGATGWVGRLYELIIYKRALSLSEKIKVENYLKAQVNL
jgi:hypothetical protein